MKNRLPRLPRGQRRCRSCLGVFPTGARAIVYCQECREHPNPGATAKGFNTLGRAGLLRPGNQNTSNQAFAWVCRCDCGTVRELSAQTVTKRTSRHCGCLTGRTVAGRRGNYKKAPGEAAFNKLWRSYCSGAKGRDLELSLTLDQFRSLVTADCAYCGNPPAQIQKSDSDPFVYNGIDRKDPSRGYTTANSVSCCRHCNFAKRRMSVPEFLDWVSKVFRHNAPRELGAPVDFTREFAGLLGGY